MNEPTTLVLVDLQTAAFDGVGVAPVHGSDLLIQNVRALLEIARRSGLPIVHIQHCAPAGELFAEDAPGWPIFAPVSPEGDEPVIRKRASDAFDGTDLHERLQKIGVQRLVVVGLQTEQCVAATCRGALRLGYAVDLAHDAHSTWPDEERSAQQIMASETAALAGDGVTLRSTEDLLGLLRRRVTELGQ